STWPLFASKASGAVVAVADAAASTRVAITASFAPTHRQIAGTFIGASRPSRVLTGLAALQRIDLTGRCRRQRRESLGRARGEIPLRLCARDQPSDGDGRLSSLRDLSRGRWRLLRELQDPLARRRDALSDALPQVPAGGARCRHCLDANRDGRKVATRARHALCFPRTR